MFSFGPKAVNATLGMLDLATALILQSSNSKSDFNTAPADLFNGAPAVPVFIFVFVGLLFYGSTRHERFVSPSARRDAH